MKNLLMILTALAAAFNCIAQDDSKQKLKKTFSIDGAFCVTTDGKAAYYNMGGAQIKFDFNHKAAFAITLLPSLYLCTVRKSGDSSAKKELIAKPLLGGGPQFFFRKWIFSFPFYYKADEGTWVATAGIGYKILFSKGN